jgi:hypothetical protein
MMCLRFSNVQQQGQLHTAALWRLIPECREQQNF